MEAFGSHGLLRAVVFVTWLLCRHGKLHKITKKIALLHEYIGLLISCGVG